MRQKIKIVFLLIIIAAACYYFSNKSKEFEQLANLTWSQIALVSLAVMGSFLLTGIVFRNLFDSFDLKLSLKEWIGLPLVLRLGNLLFFKSGTVSNAYYLKSRHSLTYPKFIVALGSLKILELYALNLMAFIISLIFYINGSLSPYIIFILLFLILVISVLLFSAPFSIAKWKIPFQEKISKALEIWFNFKSNKSPIVLLILLMALLNVLVGLRFYVAFSILNHPISITDAIGISIMVSLTGLVSIVPGNIGIREGVAGVCALYLQHDFDYGVIAIALDRVVATAWTILLGIIFFQLLHMKRVDKDMESELL